MFLPNIISALHGTQPQSSDENCLSVCSSVRLSNAWYVT